MTGATLQSVLVGTGGLSLLLAVAVALSILRPQLNPDPAAHRRVVRWLVIAILTQAAHVAEELGTGFHRLFPPLLGLAPWPTGFFVAFNLTWLAIWLLTPILLRRGWVPALALAWFLALASVANGLAHPLLALSVGGYFAGLYTSPAVGVAGVVLTSRLLTLTTPTARTPTARASDATTGATG